MYDLLVRSGRVVAHHGVFEADVAVKDDKVVSLGKNIEGHAEKTIDASGKFVLPGGIDGHTHFHLNYDGVITADDFYTGSVAAACGGVTAVIDFITPSGSSYLVDFEKRMNDAFGKSVVDFGFHLSVTDVSAERMAELEKLLRELGVTSFKVFTAYRKRGLMLDDGMMMRLMNRCSELGALILAHCENDDMINALVEKHLSEGHTQPIYHSLSRPDYVEAEAVRRVGFMAGLTGTTFLVVHLSSAMGLDAVRDLRRSGVKVLVETCPHYLVFNRGVYLREDGAKYIMSPPLKDEYDRQALWRGLADGCIDVVGSDHACFNSTLKLSRKSFAEVPGGVQGVENIIPILYSMGVRRGVISLEDLARLTSYNPANIYGLHPRKGSIIPGADADMVVFDPYMKVRLDRENLHSNLDHSIYEDVEVEGYILHTILRGEVIVEDRQFVGKKGFGRYLRRAPRSKTRE
ncbi:MAG: dihydropyrimidinase [Nitrososphaerota archaeon]